MRPRVAVLPAPTNSTRLLQQAAHEAVTQLFSPGLAYRRAGIHVLGLVPANPQQQALFFSAEELATEQRLALVIDRLNERFGRDTIYFGGISSAAYLAKTQLSFLPVYNPLERNSGGEHARRRRTAGRSFSERTGNESP